MLAVPARRDRRGHADDTSRFLCQQSQRYLIPER